MHLEVVQHNVSGRAFHDDIDFRLCPQVLNHGMSCLSGFSGIVMAVVEDIKCWQLQQLANYQMSATRGREGMYLNVGNIDHDKF